MDDSINEDFERTQKLASVLGQARQLIASELRAGLADAGLNLQQRGVLLTLARGSAKTPAALSKLAGVHPTRMTRVLDRLEDSGLIERARNGRDRRLVNVSLTQKGRAIAARHTRVVQGAWSERLSHFSKSDFDALSLLLSRLLDR
ncbi:MarR family winged helix-turn-helix transcriptional regulator [Paraburkholderia youngii]|uniref:DNA-binding MarR family transcriptional regulator n=1 Tax=Paraburkholderia youngii TaxID=2782701 RepID=A0A7W8L8M9_9BURK|nr:MarR family transcriptional regulator [Paraburkholderia youngii]MBB5402364.1 DNA-binding MarR family transcriptional regulator [Paraburkholderia youngii]